MRRPAATPAATVAATLAAVLLAACGGGGGGPSAQPPRPAPSAPADDGIPGATAVHQIDSVGVHTMAWLSDREVVTVEYKIASAPVKTPTWVIVDVTSGALRRVTPPAPPDCPDAAATGPARIRDGVVAYVEHCKQPKRSRVLSYDIATGRTAPLADAGDLVVEAVALGPGGQPRFVAGISTACAGIARLTGGRLDRAPLRIPGRGGWDLAAPLRGGDCKRAGRAAFPRVHERRATVAFVGGAPGGGETRLYVSPVATFAPEPVGPPLTSPADLVWSADGRAIYVTSREGPLLGLARIDVATGKATRLYERSVLSLALSPDGSRLAVLRPRPTTTALNVLQV